MRIATLLRANAASCLIFGALFVSAAGITADFLGDPPVWLLRLLGAGLMLNGIALLIPAQWHTVPRVIVLAFSAGDAVWVVASLTLIGAGVWITAPAGIVTALLVAGFVGGVGWLQWQTVRRQAESV